MALNIKRAETERLARKLAQRTGESVTDAIDRAVRERLERLAPSDAADRLVRMRAVLAEMGPLGPGPTREQIDAEMYDEWGLPR